MVRSWPIALYDAFSAQAFGGSQAAILTDTRDLDRATRIRIAQELGYPATGFVDDVSGHRVTAQFFSTVMEQPMCGHGTVCLMTHLADSGLFDWNGTERIEVALHLRESQATVELRRQADGRVEVLLEIAPPEIREARIDTDHLAQLLGATEEIWHSGLPIEIVAGDFVHLAAPVQSLDAMRTIAPDFGALRQFCLDNWIETVATFSTETEAPEATVHVRDFCPAVGVAESASAGTTNAAIAAYLLRHDVISPDASGQCNVLAEQGIELGRPSRVRTRLEVRGAKLKRLWVGGVATRIMHGTIDIQVD